jgi:hypothetical protein
MSIFGDIASKLFGHSKAHATEATATPAATPGAPAASTAAAPSPGAAPAAPAPASAPKPAAPAPAAAPAAGAAVQGVDVTAILDDLAAKHLEKHKVRLDWRHSIVDLLKALDLDSSLTARKELAAELHYTGDTSDSATMNVWLIKQVIAKLAANGGKLPPELLH